MWDLETKPVPQADVVAFGGASEQLPPLVLAHAEGHLGLHDRCVALVRQSNIGDGFNAATNRATHQKKSEWLGNVTTTVV